MDSSVESTIEKIKLHEQENEIILLEKQTIEATMASLKRNEHEAKWRAAKLRDELHEATVRADALETELGLEEARRQGLAGQLEASLQQLRRIQIESEQGISKVWELRNSLCNDVQKVSDQCDVWALFTKRKYMETTVTPKQWAHENTIQICQNQGLLDSAQKRRQSLMAERDRLMNEPDSGEEFLRIKNALRYSVEMATQNMRN